MHTLLDLGVDIKKAVETKYVDMCYYPYKETPLGTACRYNKANAVKFLLQHGASAEGGARNPAIHYAVDGSNSAAIAAS